MKSIVLADNFDKCQDEVLERLGDLLENESKRIVECGKAIDAVDDRVNDLASVVKQWSEYVAGYVNGIEERIRHLEARQHWRLSGKKPGQWGEQPSLNDHYGQPAIAVLKRGIAYDLSTLNFLGWTTGDGSGSVGYRCEDYFDSDGVYGGPDGHGIEPIFTKKR